MTPNVLKWRPLHEAIAWVLTRDEDFCAQIANNASAQQDAFSAVSSLEEAMMQAGCFDAIEETDRLDPPSRITASLSHKLKPGYAGRFKSLAEEYGRGGSNTFNPTIEGPPHTPEPASGTVSVWDFLLGRWHDAFRSITDRIADGDIRARGVSIDGERHLPSGDMPAASVTPAISLDHEGTVWEGPQVLWREQPRRWIEITLEWRSVLKCFPKPKAPTVNEMKRVATFKTIEAIGIEILKPMSQKEREAKIIDRVQTDFKLNVSVRHVRNCFSDACMHRT